MTVDEMLRELDYDDRGPEAGVLLTLKEAKAIQAKLRAAQALAEVVRKIEKLPNRFQIMEQITPGLELRLFNRLADFDKAGSEEAEG